MIVVDASVVIAVTDGRDALHERAVALLGGRLEERWAIHSLTFAEVLVQPIRAGRESEFLGVLRGSGIEIADTIADESVLLARLRVETRLSLPDCCPLLLAHELGVPLVTFDSKLAAAARTLGVTTV